MRTQPFIVLLPCSLALCLVSAGCEKQTPEKAPATPEATKPSGSEKSSATSNAAPKTNTAPKSSESSSSASDSHAVHSNKPGHGGESHTGSGSLVAGDKFTHSGVTFTVPEGWKSEPVSPSPMGPKAVFNLPAPEGKPECSVRITHYPNMRGMPGMDERNIERWLGMVKKADGSSITRADADISELDLGEVKVIVVDATGVIAGGMGVETSLAKRRMISAIVKHASGPHFVKVTGDVETMDKLADGVMAFLKSATKS